MSTDIEAFQHFLTEECSSGSTSLTPEEAVEKFRQLQKLQKKLSISEEESRRGKAKPLDVDAVKERLRIRITADGNTE